MPEPATPAVLPGSRARRRAAGTALFVAGITALAFNMRAAITSLPPLFPELSVSLRLSPAGLSVLASLPVLCFGLFSGTGAPLARRFGEEQVLGAGLVALAAGLALRGAFPGAMLYPGTALAAAAIALLNVLLPSLVKRRHPERAGLLVGLYLLGLYAGSILSAALAVPLYRATSDSVTIALGLWALAALAAAVVWLPQLRYRTVPAPVPAGEAAGENGGRAAGEDGGRAAGGGRAGSGRSGRGPGRVPVYRHALTWQVTGFMGLQSLTYYAALSWLPTMFRDRGVSAAGAGTLLALMTFGGAVTALVIPMLAHRARDQRMLAAVTVAASVAGLAGAWFAPLGSAVAWVLLLGMGQGAALGLAIFCTMARAPDPATAASLSSFAQSIGYLLATTGPLVVGFLHSATGGWTGPVLLVLVLTAAELAAGWPAARPLTLPAPRDRAVRAARPGG
jgi:CP family cyanate transporter-like MFS transporter